MSKSLILDAQDRAFGTQGLGPFLDAPRSSGFREHEARILTKQGER
jgi:hypothetical protein